MTTLQQQADAVTYISDAMVEAAARALCLAEFGDETIHGEARCCQVGGKDGCCLDDVRSNARDCLVAAMAVASEEQSRKATS